MHIGNQSAEFIQFFFKDPDRVFAELSDNYLDSDKLYDMAEITFLRQENLNDDLASFLYNFGYSNEEVQYVRLRDRINVTEEKILDRNSLWTSNAIDYISSNERLIFRIFEISRNLLSSTRDYNIPWITQFFPNANK